MPKKQIDFQKTVIYKIVCNDLTVEYKYVGMTTDFAKRKSCHKRVCNFVNDKRYNYKVYEIIRANGGWINWTMIQIEAYPCSTNVEARLKEREWYETLNATMNIRRPFRSGLEKKEEGNEYSKAYNETHKEQITEYQKTYKIINKEKIKEKNRLYYENNKEKALIYQNAYNALNKEQINKKKRDNREKNKNKV